MNSEIAILFIRSAIKHSFQKNLLLLCLPERILVLEKKNSRFLWQEFLKLQFYPWDLQLNILSKRTLYFIARWRVLALQKEFLVLVVGVSEIEILLKIIRCNAFLPQEFSLLFNLVSRISILLERITIKMIVLIRSLILKRRICYLGNLECLDFLRFLCYLLELSKARWHVVPQIIL